MEVQWECLIIFFANKRCIRSNICYHRKMQSCEFGLTIIMFVILHHIPILTRFLKRIVRQNMLMVHIKKKLLISCFYSFLSCSYLYHICFFPRFMHLSRDTEKNPVPKKDFSQTLSIRHWNLNSLVTYNFTKVALLQAYLSVQRFDIFCIPETYLNSSVAEDDDSLRIPGYELIRSDHPPNEKRGGVVIYYKKFLPLKLIGVNYFDVTLFLFIGHLVKQLIILIHFLII